MRVWLSRALVGMFMAVIGLVGFSATPAQAAALYSCSDYSVCLYQWTNYSGPSGSGGRWQAEFLTIWSPSSGQGCKNIGSAKWPNGTPVTNNSWSYVVNTGGSWIGNDYVMRFWSAPNCTGDSKQVSMDIDNYANFNTYWRQNVESIGIVQYV